MTWRKLPSIRRCGEGSRELARATGGSLLDDNQPLTQVLSALRARAPH
jgi:hypothetical protein